MNKLKMLRLIHNLSLSELGNKIGISRTVLSDLENDVKPFKEEHIRKLKELFNVSTDYILGYTDFIPTVIEHGDKTSYGASKDTWLLMLKRSGELIIIYDSKAKTKITVKSKLQGNHEEFIKGKYMRKRIEND